MEEVIFKQKNYETIEGYLIYENKHPGIIKKTMKVISSIISI